MELGEDLKKPARRARQYLILRARIRELGVSMGVTPTLIPANQKDIDRVHAFRLLAHSEIQAYIDALALGVIDRTADAAIKSGVLTHAGHCLVVYYSMAPLGNVRDAKDGRYPEYDSRAARKSFATSRAKLESAIKLHRKAVSSNNGIKAANVRRLLVPLGYREEVYPHGLFDQLDDLGVSRGAVAHKSGKIGIQTMPTGSNEWFRLNSTFPGLEMLERYAPRLLRPS